MKSFMITYMKTKIVFLSFIVSFIILVMVLLSTVNAVSYEGYGLRIYSPYPFYINGKLVSPGTYYEGFGEVVNLTFPTYFYKDSVSRCYLNSIDLNESNAESNTPGVLELYNSSNSTIIVLNTSDFYETYVTPRYLQQYYVNVTYNLQLPEAPIKSGWYDSQFLFNIHLPLIENISSNYRYYTYEILVNGVPESYFHVGSPLNIKILSYYQVYEKFINNITGYLNGTLVKLSTGWYNYGDDLNLTSPLYTGVGSRLIIWGNEVGNFKLTSPITFDDNETNQFYVNFTSPTFIKSNGLIYETTGQWFNESQKFMIESSYPINATYRYFSEGNYPRYCVGVYGSMNITDKQVVQYLLTFPVQLEVQLSNGTEMTFSSQWINVGTTVHVLPQTAYADEGKVRYIVPSQNFSRPEELQYLKQYLLNVQPSIVAMVNGTNTTIGVTWMNAGTNVTLYKVYYINSTTRMVLLSSNTMSFIVNSPMNISAVYQLQDLVQVYGKYSTSIIYSFNNWEPYGSTVTIPPLLSYDKTLFQLNSTVNTILVNSPKFLNLSYDPFNVTSSNGIVNNQSNSNFTFILVSVIGIAAIAVLVYTVLIRRNPQ
ncbi:hypothetical protein IC007_2228 [Sulfuracidifex tepidarius]|uniref:Thermopsin n=2 Tax=Sulfuracidifex tepidarius TaxID=1294262 RepID=A0A510E591_9CREN|nr:hypothetical protein IC007_2228 [Sulfuracidifex tepidarius]